MKRWTISAFFTCLMLLILIIASFFVPEEKTFEGKIASKESTVKIVQRIPKKKESQNQTSSQEKVKKTDKKNSSKKTIEKSKPKQTEKTKIENKIENQSFETKSETEISTETSEMKNENLESENTNEIELSSSELKFEEDYKQYVLKRISSKKVYPLSARTKSQEGKVRLHLIIGIDGQLLLSEIVSPCEFEILNEAAFNSVKKSAPFKKMKNAKRNLDLTFTMDFSLK